MKYTNFRSIAAAAASSFVLALAACGGESITTGQCGNAGCKTHHYRPACQSNP